MNQVLEEMMAITSDSNYLEHYGMPRRSGRYPWGSGEDPYQRTRDFAGRLEELKKKGWTETPENIKKEFGMTTTQYRAQKGLANDQRRMIQVAKIKSLMKDGLGPTAIGKKMGISESTVRSLLKPEAQKRMMIAQNTADFIRSKIKEKGMIDVGTGVERELNISKEKLNQALAILESEGFPIYKGGIPQVTNKGQQINQKVICPPGTEHKEIYNFENVHTLKEYITRDDGVTYEKKFHYPESMDSNRLMIRYKEDGGIEKDGLIELRRGVNDLSLGESKYSQVRILVDGTHYIKGMAVYGDDKDFPKGVDVIFNTNKTKDKSKMEVLKEIKDDPENPFGSNIKETDRGGQYWYDPKTGERVSSSTSGAKLGLINKTREEGDWNEWKDTLPSQFLSKQSLSMAKKQLKLAVIDKEAEFDEICSLTNPTVKKHLLSKFADECDAAAVDLKAAALPGQKYHVIMPVPSIKDTEVYAPGYENGTKLALIRYPHGGTFEIPILTVNNKNTDAKKMIGTDSIDAVCINSKVAERLSGADFDGDTVMCIPTHDRGGKVKITSTPPLKGLEGFDPKMSYPERKGMQYMTKRGTQTQMGIISNLITDMTLAGAGQDELAAAVRHSMVVIDAYKHKLDYKKSEQDNNISALKKKYQITINEDGTVKYGGASTLLSRSKGEATVLKRQGTPKYNMPLLKNGKPNPDYDPSRPEGALIYKTADDIDYTRTKTNKRTGETTTITKQRTQKSTNMAETDDARTLISPKKWDMEIVYADYANKMKALANESRKTEYNTGKIEYSSKAKEAYKQEVNSLMSKLNIALLNAPKERQAQLKANIEVNSKKEKAKQSGEKMSNEEIKKASQRAISKYRTEVGSVARRDRSIIITDKEWEAIQAGAISEAKLKKILDNTDVDNLRERATPRTKATVSQAQINRIKALQNSNYTIDEISRKVGLSKSTIANYLKGVK